MGELGTDVVIQYLTIAFSAALLLCFLLIIVMLVKVSKQRKRLDQFMNSESGESLESVILEKLSKVDKFLERQGELIQRMDQLSEQQLACVSKVNIYKYRAFKEMGGDTSFVLALLDKENNGTLLNGMTGSEATYIYAKEIVNGEAKVTLSKEEMIALEDCMKK